MKISLIIPSRNNLKYLKWAYTAIRKNQEDHLVEICIADDMSSDGTWEWCQQILNEGDTHFKCIRNEGPTRLGHTILYDRLINEVAGHDICMIYHADMYLCPGALNAIEKYIKPKTIVSLTRIEPPLHPDGPEKVLADWGIETENFDEPKFLEWFNHSKPFKGHITTEGIFAPWAFYKSDFQEIGGHDPLYAPQSKEDSDIFNRFQLNEVKFVQTWEGYVYHMTCRGSRFNPVLTTPGTNSTEWETQNIKSTRNFIRKWGHFVKHDSYMKPIIPPRYLVGFYITHCSLDLLNALEPWCTTVYVENTDNLIEHYIAIEQPNTSINLQKKLCNRDAAHMNLIDVLVRIDGNRFSNEDFHCIQQLSEIIQSNNEIGSFELGNLKIEIKALTQYQKQLIKL